MPVSQSVITELHATRDTRHAETLTPTAAIRSSRGRLMFCCLFAVCDACLVRISQGVWSRSDSIAARSRRHEYLLDRDDTNTSRSNTTKTPQPCQQALQKGRAQLYTSCWSRHLCSAWNIYSGLCARSNTVADQSQVKHHLTSRRNDPKHRVPSRGSLKPPCERIKHGCPSCMR